MQSLVGAKPKNQLLRLWIAGEPMRMLHGIDEAGRRQHFESLRQRCPWIQDVRIKGAMIGVELSVDGVPIVNHCLQNRLLINCTHGTILRLLPALTLSDGELDEGCNILEQVLLAHKA